MVPPFLSTRFLFVASSILPFGRAFVPSPCFTRLRSQQTLPSVEAPQSRTLLQVSTAPPPRTISEESADEEQEANSVDELPIPWSDFQDWALRDNLPRYVVSSPSNDSRQQTLYALWRTMMRDVTELGGYPIDMLQEMHARQLKRQDSDATLSVTPGVLPLLDEFEFDASGGLSGRVYGIPGVADGSNIVTKEVKDVQFTVPKGYIQTDDGAVAYELGTPRRESYSLDAGSNRVRDFSSNAVGMAAGMAKSAMTNVPAIQEDPDTMLVRLGVTTAILLGGATAINMLSHHLTVNVFWV